jgi:tellurite resistance protein
MSLNDLFKEKYKWTNDELVALTRLLLHQGLLDGEVSSDEATEMVEIITVQLILSQTSQKAKTSEKFNAISILKTCQNLDIIDALKTLKRMHSDKKHLVIEYLERIGHADGNYDEKERAFTNSMMSHLKIRKDSDVPHHRDNFDNEILLIFKEFEKTFEEFDETEFTNKYELYDIDLKYWLDIIESRANSNIGKFEKNNMNQQILEWIWGHAAEYKNRLENPDGDIYNNLKTFNDGEKLYFLKMRIVAYGEIYKRLTSVMKKINEIKIKYKVDKTSIEVNLDNKIAHAKAAVYGAIKYSLSIGISKKDIAFWFDDFEDNKELITGIDPFDALIAKAAAMNGKSNNSSFN